MIAKKKQFLYLPYDAKMHTLVTTAFFWLMLR